MDSKEDQFDTLVDAIIANGETVGSCGHYDEDADEGHDPKLVQNCDLFIIVERIDGEEDIKYTDDEAEARQIISDVKNEIEKEEAEE